MFFKTLKNKESKAQLIKKSFSYSGRGWISKLFLLYVIPVIRKGIQNKLDFNDFNETPEEITALRVLDPYKKAWNFFHKKWERKEVDDPLKKTLSKVYRAELILLGLLAFLKDIVLKNCQCLLLGYLIQYFNGDFTDVKGAVICGSLILTVGLNVISSQVYTLRCQVLALKIKTTLSTTIYQKCLRITLSELEKSGYGQVSNFLSNDVGKFDFGIQYINYLWIAPISLIVSTVILYFYVGFSSLAGVGMSIFIIPFQGVLGKCFGKLRMKVAKRTDKRLKIIKEVFDNILFVKMQSWEPFFNQKIKKTRETEIYFIRLKGVLMAIMQTVLQVSTTIALLTTFIFYINSGNQLTAPIAFVILSLYNNIAQITSSLFPCAIIGTSEILAAINRIQLFLLLNEKKHDDNKKRASHSSIENFCPFAVQLNNFSLKWKLDDDEVLNDISFSLSKNEIIFVTGSVGSGKSSLLRGILGEGIQLGGSLKVNGCISYSAQTPLLLSTSVRNNILFGLPYNHEWYSVVMKACELERDLSLLPQGDQSLVGEKGLELSGGQRGRVSLARAIYRRSDIYLLDEPLSGLDPIVGNKILQNVIRGILKNETVIVVTHQLSSIEPHERVIELESGKVKRDGIWRDLAKNYAHNYFEDEKINDASKNIADETDKIEKRRNLSGKREEEKEFKSNKKIGMFYIFKYFALGNNAFLILLLLFLFVATQVVKSISDLFLQIWTHSEENKSANSEFSNLNIFCYLTLLLFGTMLSRTLLYYWTCQRTSSRTHKKILNAVLRAPMNFFRKNSTGRIMNRFTKDMGTMDDTIPLILFNVLFMVLQAAGALILVSFMNKVLILPSVLLLIVFYYIRRYFILASSNISRLEALAKSPIFSHLSETLSDLATVRVFGIEKILSDKYYDLLNRHSCISFYLISANRWYSLVLQLLGYTYFIIVTLSFMLIITDAATVGLAVSQALSLSTVISYLMSQSTDLENELVAVERIVEYGKIESENNSGIEPPQNWPSAGSIKFHRVFSSYDDEKNVLIDISLSIKSREKIGIVGRTGAGKSSLASSLFRILNISHGSILIDGLNIGYLDLKSVRSSLTIIPQCPVLFSLSVRSNLDPYGLRTDAQIWTMLASVKLSSKIDNLEQKISDTGAGINLSSGEKQLFSFARAGLSENKILILDEATAHTDSISAEIINDILKNQFINCTIITIAHKLETVMSSDRICVIDDGKVVEFDDPKTLLSNIHSRFYKMVNC